MFGASFHSEPWEVEVGGPVDRTVDCRSKGPHLRDARAAPPQGDSP